ncbi:nitrilase-related carbon-nitrogen hydrolase [Rhodoferax sp.]|uniref:nitrilase-related carbon-nitrogen hydrolase n=1 Tax=Rhodoferax sp. TaxID=50421 RepID=UPI00285057D0|nr:nitrilase-related carbon-nitrogen hydrolase [Rhodoferax sp.]MDR3371772.1 nitrilase-related carbon-nitrogen hydrolase [Rhodoferax sp.]
MTITGRARTLWWTLRIRALSLVASGTLCGLAWGHEGHTWLLGLAAVMPLLWHWSASRWLAGAVALAYYLAGSRGLPFGAGIFFAESAPAWFSWALWLVAGMVNALPWFVLWSQNPRRQAWTLPVTLALTALPPLGFIGWTNPLTAAGVVFPGLGFVGLILLVAGMVAVVLRRWPVVAAVAGVAVAANVSTALWVKPPPWVAFWSGRDTHFARLQTDAKPDLLGEGQRVMQILMIAGQLEPGRVVVLPETVLPRARQGNDFAATMLADVSASLKAKGSAILVGAELAAPGQQLQNVLVALGDASGPLVQRVPVPIGMWRPWAAESVAADPLASGVGKVAGRKVAYSICYEQLLVFPLLVSVAHGPDLIVGAANDWWARDTSIPTIQGQALDSWGVLFGLPVVRATNL